MRRGFDGSTLNGIMSLGCDGPSLVRTSSNGTRQPRCTRVATSPATNSRNSFGTRLGNFSTGKVTGLNGCSTESPLAPGTRNSYTLTPSLTHVRMVVRSGWSFNNTSLQNGNSRDNPPGAKSSPILTGTSHGAVHAAPSHSERMESHETALSADLGRNVAAAHSACGDGNTGLSGKCSLTFPPCAVTRLRHAVPSTYVHGLIVMRRVTGEQKQKQKKKITVPYRTQAPKPNTVQCSTVPCRTVHKLSEEHDNRKGLA